MSPGEWGMTGADNGYRQAQHPQCCRDEGIRRQRNLWAAAIHATLDQNPTELELQISELDWEILRKCNSKPVITGFDWLELAHTGLFQSEKFTKSGFWNFFKLLNFMEYDVFNSVLWLYVCIYITILSLLADIGTYRAVITQPRAIMGNAQLT